MNICLNNGHKSVIHSQKETSYYFSKQYSKNFKDGVLQRNIFSTRHEVYNLGSCVSYVLFLAFA